MLVLVMLWLGALAVSLALYVVVVLGRGVVSAVRRSPARPSVGALPRTAALNGRSTPQRRSA